MKEARDGFACIEEVDVDTFARFVEYCYTGDYPAAEHVVVLDTSSIQHQVGVSERVAETINKPQPKPEPELPPDSTRLELYTMWLEFKNLSWCTPPQEPKPPQYSARINEQACEDYTDVFLSHARLYVFADTYGIERLRVLSLQKLHQSLVNFTLFAERTTDIALLLQYAYQHTPERTDTMDDLRELLIRYVCCHLEQIKSNSVFQETLKAENSSSVDLIEILLPSLPD